MSSFTPLSQPPKFNSFATLLSNKQAELKEGVAQSPQPDRGKVKTRHIAVALKKHVLQKVSVRAALSIPKRGH